MSEANEGKIDSLNSEIEQFAESLPYWAKFLSAKLLGSSLFRVGNSWQLWGCERVGWEPQTASIFRSYPRNPLYWLRFVKDTTPSAFLLISGSQQNLISYPHETARSRYDPP